MKHEALKALQVILSMWLRMVNFESKVKPPKSLTIFHEVRLSHQQNRESGLLATDKGIDENLDK